MSVTTFETITHVNVPPITETTGGDLDIDEYGLDTIQRKFEVRPDSLALFLRTYYKGLEDATYKSMYSMGPKVSDLRGPMMKATVLFKGSILQTLGAVNPNPNDPRKESVKGGKQRQQVVLNRIITDDLIAQKNITYDAPWTEWRYITTTFPGDLGPAHAGELVVKNKTARIINLSGLQGPVFISPNIVPPGERPQPPADTEQFNGILKINNSKFEYEQVGRVWTVMERNELLVVDYFTFLIGMNFDW